MLALVYCQSSDIGDQDNANEKRDSLLLNMFSPVEQLNDLKESNEKNQRAEKLTKANHNSIEDFGRDAFMDWAQQHMLGEGHARRRN